MNKKLLNEIQQDRINLNQKIHIFLDDFFHTYPTVSSIDFYVGFSIDELSTYKYEIIRVNQITLSEMASRVVYEDPSFHKMLKKMDHLSKTAYIFADLFYISSPGEYRLSKLEDHFRFNFIDLFYST